jgi:SAM-dependent methyltransferase
VTAATAAGVLPAAEAERLLRLWDEQQSAYVAGRESRFDAMLTVLRLHAGDRPAVLDLGCGPGALAARVLRAFPAARVVAVDHDPVLLPIARGVLARYGDRARVLDLDLADPGWAGALGAGPVDAVVSTTALHWLPPADLAAVYTAAAGLLRPDGLLLNGDHLRFGPESPALRDLAARHDDETQRAGFAAGALTYDGWYAEALRLPGLAEAEAERQRRFAHRPPPPPAPLAFHLAALRAAGFAEAGTVWQYLDDYVVAGRR